MSRINVRVCIVAAALFLGCGSVARAEQALIIQDTSGFTRAASDVANSGNVEFTLTNSQGVAVDGADVKLVNTATQESMMAKSEAGIARFESVPPGTWTVSTTAPDVTFTNIAVIDALAPVAAGVGASTVELVGLAGAGVAGAAGLTAGIVGISSGDGANDDDEPLPLSPVD